MKDNGEEIKLKKSQGDNMLAYIPASFHSGPKTIWKMSSEKKYNKIKGIIPSDDCLIKNWITIFERCSFFLFLSSVNFLKNTCPTDPAIIATGAWTMRHAKEKYPKINIPNYFPIKILIAISLTPSIKAFGRL